MPEGWTQVGSNIETTAGLNAHGWGEYFSKSLSVSDDGTRIAIGASSYDVGWYDGPNDPYYIPDVGIVYVYDYDLSSQTWGNPIGQLTNNINNEALSKEPESVSLFLKQ